MKPKRIILIRHGESEGNTDRIVYGKKPDYALLLTQKGMQQAIEAGMHGAIFVHLSSAVV